ncbi:response regulator [Lyngbya aestuarii]|uniref:response regulator n=1 Tax=Lyngbya aestuarii TaxID=118322 RepID=UPI00403D60B8
MATYKVFTTNELAKRIQACTHEQFTGLLSVTDTQNQTWSFSFHQGYLIGGTGGVHTIRRWCRQLLEYCPRLPLETAYYGSDRFQYCDYDSLAKLVMLGKVEQKQMAAVIEANITEIFFDIIQQGEQLYSGSEKQPIFEQIPRNTKNSQLALVPANRALHKASQIWEDWQQAGLLDVSPNMAPVILQARELRRQTSPLAYDNLTTLADGNRTFRDLALKLKQNLLPLTQSIMPYVRKGLISLSEVADFNLKHPSSQTVNQTSATITSSSISSVPPQKSNATKRSRPTAPLIACIDDSRLDSEMMSQLLTQSGYRCLSILDPLQALVELLEYKPDLIFLDLVMPVVNGYEVCAQIRRISIFKETPVIILTSNDGIVDRVRAKMVGSTGFLAKPIATEKVLKILQRHLPASKYL